jgi:hypothetical protein
VSTAVPSVLAAMDSSFLYVAPRRSVIVATSLVENVAIDCSLWVGYSVQNAGAV